jgi:hypothetical protein
MLIGGHGDIRARFAGSIRKLDSQARFASASSIRLRSAVAGARSAARTVSVRIFSVTGVIGSGFAR